MNKNLLRAAGIINLITAIIHLILGQIDLINPLIYSTLDSQQKGELTGVWHMATILLFATTFYLLRAGFSNSTAHELGLLKFIGILYILLGLPFVATSIWFSVLAPQWILLMPTGVLTLAGINSISVKRKL